ncbi:hypothetical protein QBC34DRAFT_197744 [Podospora aff. communis PSN243]|uniref:Uncharacterized protein n=1 Tax=Podospora aff. communis PSN243 TaxID=3040156 RepID=A0AAV9G5M7_9PEZI|nr:hypothetical protein QBC34DRAFT_197744 [Podospora aff. communis PSN243]
MHLITPLPKARKSGSSVQENTPALHAAGRSSSPKVSGPTSIVITMDEGLARFGTNAQQTAGKPTPTSQASLVTSEPQTANVMMPQLTSSTTDKEPFLTPAPAGSLFPAGTSSRNTTSDMEIWPCLGNSSSTDVGALPPSTISTGFSIITSQNGCPLADPGDAPDWPESILLPHVYHDHTPIKFREVAYPLLPFHDNVCPKNSWLVDKYWRNLWLGCCLHDKSVGGNLNRMMAMLGSCASVQEAPVPRHVQPSLVGSLNIRHPCKREHREEVWQPLRFPTIGHRTY